LVNAFKIIPSWLHCVNGLDKKRFCVFPAATPLLKFCWRLLDPMLFGTAYSTSAILALQRIAQMRRLSVPIDFRTLWINSVQKRKAYIPLPGLQGCNGAGTHGNGVSKPFSCFALK